MSKFKVGDRVRIAKSSKYYDDSDINNPIHVDGKIIESYKEGSSNYRCIVNWDNGMFNGYRESDLELVSDTKPEFKVGHGAICIKKTHEHNVGDVLLVTNINKTALELDFGGDFTYSRSHFTPCPNPPLKHYKQRIAYALGADIEFKAPNGSWVENNIPSFLYSVEYRVAIPDQDPNAEKREQLQAEIERLQSELDSLGGDL